MCSGEATWTTAPEGSEGRKPRVEPSSVHGVGVFSSPFTRKQSGYWAIPDHKTKDEDYRWNDNGIKQSISRVLDLLALMKSMK